MARKFGGVINRGNGREYRLHPNTETLESGGSIGQMDNEIEAPAMKPVRVLWSIKTKEYD
jgi:hypothetical protein